MERSEITWTSFDFSNEGDFEKIILKRDVLKNYRVFDAKKTLNTLKNYRRYADVLLIQKDYRYWSIGEIEISKHSFKSHIFPQLIEIFTLLELNIDLIRKNYLEIPGLPVSKEIRNLINFNKPFMNLIIDKIPSNYNNILPLLNSFCNVNMVRRLRDNEQNYIYINDDNYQDSIKKKVSDCYISSIALFIDRPNLVDLDNDIFETIDFNGEKLAFQQQFKLIEGVNRVFWIIDRDIPDGKYKLENSNNTLKIYK